MIVKPPILQAEENRIRKEVAAETKRRYQEPFVFTTQIILGLLIFTSAIVSIFQLWFIPISGLLVIGLVLDTFWERKHEKIEITGTNKTEIVDMEDE
jgi:Na+/H+ antiporter NhaC